MHFVNAFPTNEREITLEQFQKENHAIFNAISSNLEDSGGVYKQKTGQKDKIVILTDQILSVEKNKVITYTFGIEKPTSSFSDFENLVIFKYSNTVFKFGILMYQYTEQGQLPYKIRYKKISQERLQNFEYVKDILKRKKVVNGIILDDCVRVYYRCPYGGTSKHGSAVCGSPPGTGPGSTMYLDFSNCNTRSGGDTDEGDGTNNENGNDGESDDSDGFDEDQAPPGPDGAGGVVEEQIIDLLTGKAKCLNNHLTKKGNTFVKDIIKKFQGKAAKFDIQIQSKNKVFTEKTNTEVNAKTYPEGSIIHIEISTSKLAYRPALSAARTLIHEYIHADMFRKIKTTNYDGDLDFKITYEKYKKGNFKATPQHNTMADLYVNSIRDALKSFHKDVLIGDYNYLTNNGANPLPDAFYEALAWQGLKDANVKAYTDLSKAKKTALANALKTHYHSTTKNCPK